jgi:hypothetical protein
MHSPGPPALLRRKRNRPIQCPVYLEDTHAIPVARQLRFIQSAPPVPAKPQ